EEAFRTLEGTSFATDARLELLTLYERSRDWRKADETARKLEGSGAGSFANRISHYWCELALEADARRQPAEAQSALERAREAAPQAARPLILMGERHAQAGRHLEALAAWDELLTVRPASFALVAGQYAASALACGEGSRARTRLQALHDKAPTSEVLSALLKLAPDAASRESLLMAHLQHQPSLSAAASLLKEHNGDDALPSSALARVQQVVTLAARPLQRYRCAACGFEAQHYFWQCPGCQSWDSYPPQRLEDL